MSNDKKKTDNLDYVLEKSAFLGGIGRAARNMRGKAGDKWGKFQDRMAQPMGNPDAKATKTRAENLSNIGKAGLFGGLAASLPMLAASNMKDKLQNDTRRKSMVEDLYMNDPIISQAEREDVLQYYGTIMTVAPSISLDKNVVRELLQNFIKFGRVDIQTIKTLADTEKTMKDKDKDSFKATEVLKMMG